MNTLILAVVFSLAAQTAAAQGGGMQAGVQPTEEELQRRFQQELDDLIRNQKPDSKLPDSFRDRIMDRISGMSPEERQEYLDRYLRLHEMKDKIKEIRKTDPGKADELRREWRAARDELWKLDPDLTMMLGRVYFNSNESDRWGRGDGPHKPDPDRVRDAQDWARIGRDDPDIMRGVGRVLQDAGDKDGAAQAYKRAISLNPRDSKALTGLAQIQAQEGDYEHAVENAQRALQVDPGNQNAYALAKMYGGRTGASSADVPGGGQPGGSQFFSGGSGGDYGRTVPAFQTGQPAGRQPAPALRDSIELAETAARLLTVKDAAGAKAAAEKALALHPENLRALWTLYQANAMRKDYAGALTAVERALELQPRDANLLNAKSNLLSRLGRFEEAMGVADLVLAANSGDANGLFNKAYALSGMGRREEALTYLRRAAARESRYQPFYERAAALPPDADLVALFTGDAPAAKPAAPPSSSGKRWGLVAAGFLGGLLLIVLGVTQGGTLLTTLTRGLSRAGQASPAVQPMPVGAPPPPTDGLAAGGIRIERKIGQGGMGVVYQGTDTNLERPVAIKKMREEIRTDLRERDRFIKEAKTVAALRHPNIVEIYSIVEDGSDVYLVFEYVTGKTVHELTYERGALPAGWAIGVIKAVASALDYAHKRGVVHRDLKPSNIMVEEDGMVKVMDFGVARMAKDSLSRMSMTNTVVGTPPYMAPEQEQGIVRRESDVYALAVCLYEMVTGSLPFQGVGAGMLMAKLNGTYVPASRLVQGLPPGFDEVMARALAPDPEKRLKSAGEFAAALSSLPV